MIEYNNKNVKRAGIYKISNLITNKFYIGSAKSLYNRWTKHISDLNLNKHANKYLQSSWNLHGSENFKFEIIEFIDNIENLLIREQYYLDLYKPFNNVGYNIALTAGSQLGCKRSKETKKKISVLNTGRKRSEEVKKKMSIASLGINNSNYGKKTSDEVRKKISIGNMGKKHSAEHISNFILANVGRKNTDETKKKISEKNKGRKLTEKNKINMSLVRINKGVNKRTLNLIEENVLGIREKYATGKYLYKELSKEYDFSIATIGRIIK